MSTTRKPTHVSRRYRDICKRLGLDVTSTMGGKDVYQMIQTAIKKPMYKNLYDEFLKDEAAENERREREEYGDEIHENLEKWRRLCNADTHYATVFKQGRSIKWDIIELDNVCVDDENAAAFEIEANRPRRSKEKDVGVYLEWDKEVTLKPEGILIIQALPKRIDMYDIPSYEKLLSVCETWAKKFRA